MSSISLETKNEKSLTLEDTDNDLTWDEATMTWDEATSPWQSPGRPITKESKNTKSLANESENV